MCVSRLCVLWATGSSTDFEPLCGRPHAVRLDGRGQLIVADSYLGLHSVDPQTGRKTLLVSNAQGEAQLSPFQSLPTQENRENSGTFYAEPDSVNGASKAVYETVDNLLFRTCKMVFQIKKI